MKTNRIDYGIDAPNVVRNLFITGGVFLVIWISTITGMWNGDLTFGPIAGATFDLPLNSIGFLSGFGFTAAAIWMIWSSKVSKLKIRDKLLDHITWNGNEQVLDIGCGRGLMVIGAAKRLTTGKAYGIDIWQAEDLSGNSINATLKNIKLEGVEDKVEVKTADMRQLPFPDNSIDIIVSCSAIHNIYDKDEREKAIAEITRVLKQGGYAIIDDIRYLNEYKSLFSKYGCSETKKVNSFWSEFSGTLFTFGSLHPATLLVRK